MLITLIASGWLIASVVLAFVIGKAVRIADRKKL